MLTSPFAFSYKDVKDESSKAFGFSKISGALSSFEAYLEDEFQEFVKNYSILHEQAQNLISTKPSLLAIRQNPMVLSNYISGINKWQRDASNLSFTGGSFIRKLPVRNCILSLQQKLRPIVLKQLYAFHEIGKNNIALDITSVAWNFRCFSERFRAIQLFDSIGPTYALPTPQGNDSAEDIYTTLKTAALAKIAQTTPSRKVLFDILVGLIPSAVVVVEEFNTRTLLQEAIFQQAKQAMSDDLVSAMISICEPWDALVQGYCTFHPFADAMKNCTSIDVKVSMRNDDRDDGDKKAVDRNAVVANYNIGDGDLTFNFPDVARKMKQDSEDGKFAVVTVKNKPEIAANVLSEQNFTEKALHSCLTTIKKATSKVKKYIKSLPGIDFSRVPELIKVVNTITEQTFTQLRAFSENVQSLMASVSAPLKAVQDEMSTKLADIQKIAQADQPWTIKSSEFKNLQGLIRQANSSFMKELLFDYEPLQALISMYNDQFLGSPQLQINVNFQSSNDVIATIHNVASSDWFTSIETSGDKHGLTHFFTQHLKLKYADMEKSVKRLEVACRRVKESANDFVKAPTKKKLLNMLRARVFKFVIVDQSFKLAFAPFGYTFCKYMTEKGAWARAEIDAEFKAKLRNVLQRFMRLDFQSTFLLRAELSNPAKILSHLPKSPEALEAQSLVAFIASPPALPLISDVDSVIDGKGDLDKFYGGLFKGKQPLSVFSIKSSLHAFLVSWHSFFRPGKVPSKEHLGFKTPVVIKKMLTSSEKIISFKSDEQGIYVVLSDPAGKSSEEKAL
jgi:hypothetical protein